MTVGESIKSLRTASGLLQRDLAKRAGISASLLSLVEKGRREPTIPLLRAIGRALEIPPGVLVVVALADDPSSGGSMVARRTRRMGLALFKAARHAVLAKRAREQRASLRQPTRRSA